MRNINCYHNYSYYFAGNACEIDSENTTMALSLQKEKSSVTSRHSQQTKNFENGGVTATSISSKSSLYLKPNTTSFQSDNHKWNPNLSMRTQNLTSFNSVNLSDKLGSEKHNNVWKKRKRNNMNQQNVEKLISKAYSNVIFSNLPITILVYVTAF